ncbi:rRNA maturation RNase YbeY [Pseudomonadota bacterium]
MKTFELDFAIRISGYKGKKSDFEPLFKRTIKFLQKNAALNTVASGGQIHLVLTDDEEISFTNSTYRGEKNSTDVISLSYLDEDAYPKDNLIGEVLISVETARRQAKEHGKTLTQELRFLFLHGLLHIFGFNHKTAKDRKEMFDLQDEILRTKSWRKVID